MVGINKAEIKHLTSEEVCAIGLNKPLVKAPGAGKAIVVHSFDSRGLYYSIVDVEEDNEGE